MKHYSYSLLRMDINSPKGTKVIFDAPNNGWPFDIERARGHLQVGKVYVVSHTVISSSSTEVYLEGFRLPFNSVQFGSLTAHVETA